MSAQAGANGPHLQIEGIEGPSVTVRGIYTYWPMIDISQRRQEETQEPNDAEPRTQDMGPGVIEVTISGLEKTGQIDNLTELMECKLVRLVCHRRVANGFHHPKSLETRPTGQLDFDENGGLPVPTDRLWNYTLTLTKQPDDAGE